MKNLYSEMWGNTVRAGACENSEGLFMYDCPVETVECIWVNIWCMFDWIWCRNNLQKCTPFSYLHTVNQLVRSAKIETLCVSPTREQT